MGHVLEQSVAESHQVVVEVAFRALARRLDGRAEEIPPALVEAIASAQGDRDEVLRQTEQVFQTDRPLELILFDTSRPPVIAGASAILKGLNAEIATSYRDFVIFSGGGEGMLLAPVGQGE